jgi:hypothetical protein
MWARCNLGDLEPDKLERLGVGRAEFLAGVDVDEAWLLLLLKLLFDILTDDA